MIISIILFYLVGIFFAYLIIGYENDKIENKWNKIPFLVLIMSWFVVIFWLIWTFVMIPDPSLKQFVKLFSKKNER